MYYNLQSKNSSPVRIALFVGGRTASLYRAAINGYFKKFNANVVYITKDLYGSNKDEGMGHNEYKTYDDDNVREILSNEMSAKARGDDLVDLVLSGRADAATIGETSFIKSIRNGAPIVAVANLGHDIKEYPGHAMVFRKGLKIKAGKDFKGMRFISRRSSGGDYVFLREFFISEGLDPDHDVKIIESNLGDDKFREAFKDGSADGAFAHLRPILSDLYLYNIYRPLNWVNADLSQAVLVFKKEFLEKNPEQVEKIVEAIMINNMDELSLPENKKPIDIENDKTRMKKNRGYHVGRETVQIEFRGMRLPKMDKIPYVNIDLLNEMQILLLKHNVIDKTTKLDGFIDNTFVKRISQKYNNFN